MAGSATRPWPRLGAALLLGTALGACTLAARGPLKALPAELATGDALVPIPTPGLAEEPPLAARPEPTTGLPPGWYVPDPPAAPETPPEAVAQLDPAARIAMLLRHNPWITRFWSELTPAEQGRVTRALARRGTPGPAPAAWDPMGLADRVALLFGPARAVSG